jgi:hypothetical protein
MVISYFSYNHKSFYWQFVVLSVAILILFEQTIQFVIVKNHDMVSMNIIKGWLNISPVPAKGAEGFISIRRLIIDRFNVHFYYIFYPVLFFLSYFVYRFYYFCLPKQGKLLAISAIFFLAGIFGSCFNWLVRNHGYDFIEIEYLIIFDIKDFYIELWSSTVFLLLIEAIPSLKKVKSVRRHLLSYIRWESAYWYNILTKAIYFSKIFFKRIKENYK